MPEVTLESLRKAMHDCIGKGIADYLKAPARRGYSKTVGTWMRWHKACLVNLSSMTPMMNQSLSVLLSNE